MDEQGIPQHIQLSTNAQQSLLNQSANIIMRDVSNSIRGGDRPLGSGGMGTNTGTVPGAPQAPGRDA